MVVVDRYIAADAIVVRVKEKITINLQTNVCSEKGPSGRYPSFLVGIIFITAWLLR